MLRLIRKIFASILVMVCAFSAASASDNKNPPRSLFSPVSDNSDFTFGTGLNVTIIPRRIAENTLRVIPMAEFFLTKRFLKAFQWETSAGIVVVRNYFATGLYYSYRLNAWSFGLGDKIEIWGGFLENTSFSAVAYSLAQHPGIIVSHGFAAGYPPWVPSTLTLRGFVNVSGYQYTKVGDAVFIGRGRIFTGFGVDLTFEYNTPNYGVFFTARVNYNKADYGFWLAFTDSNLFYVYPTLLLGMRF